MEIERQDFFWGDGFLVARYFIGFTPRSLQMFLAKTSFISVCRGMAERLFNAGLCHPRVLRPFSQ